MLSVVKTTEGQKEISKVFSGELPDDLEGILERSAEWLGELYPSFVRIAKLTWQTQFNNFNTDPKVYPVKVVIKEGFPDNFEPGVLIENSVLVTRGSLGEAQSFINEMVAEDTFYCKVSN